MTQGGENQSSHEADVTAGAQAFSKEAIGAATSKLISASIGDIAVLFSRSPKYKHYSLADIEWLVLPAVFSGQFFIAEASHAETGHRAPVAVITWARVSTEVDERLTENVGNQLRLRPDEWTSGNIRWLIDAVGDPQTIGSALKALLDGPFKDRDTKVATADGEGRPIITSLHDLARIGTAEANGGHQ